MPRAIPWSPGISFDLRGTGDRCVQDSRAGLGDDSAECLLYKHEDHSPHPQNPGEMLGVSRGSSQTGGSLPLAAQPVQLIGEL